MGNYIRIGALLIGYLITGLVAYGAMQTDIAVVKTRQEDQYTQIQLQLKDIQDRQHELASKLDLMRVQDGRR